MTEGKKGKVLKSEFQRVQTFQESHVQFHAHLISLDVLNFNLLKGGFRKL